MLDALNTISAEAWAGIAGFVSAIGMAIATIRFGLLTQRTENKAPQLPKPPSLDARIDEILERQDETNRRLESLQTDQAILLDRTRG